jgi:hypothetical protein
MELTDSRRLRGGRRQRRQPRLVEGAAGGHLQEGRGGAALQGQYHDQADNVRK